MIKSLHVMLEKAFYASTFVTILSMSARGRSTQQDSSPVRSNQDSQDSSTRKISLLSRPFGLGWRDRNKVSNKPPFHVMCDIQFPSCPVH